MNDITVFQARKILTMNPIQPEATHVAVRDGRVLAVRKGETEDDVNRFDLVLGFPELLKQRLRQAGGK